MASQRKPGDIKVGVIGYGGAFNMGKGHLAEMQAAGMTPTAVAEIDATRLKVAEKDFPGIETYLSVEEMLRRSDVELLAVITPHNTHAKLAIQCLKAGRHVVVEKPFAITTAECDAMIAAARKSRVVLSTYHNRHWDGCILTAVKTIRSGVIGDVVRVQAHMGWWGQPGDWWRSSKSISGGILYDWGVHLLEYTLQIVDSDILEVSGHLARGFWGKKVKWGKDTIEDEGCLTVRFASGAWSSLMISQINSRPFTGWVEVAGTLGAYMFDYGVYELTTHRDGQTVITQGRNQPSEGHKLYRNIAHHICKGERLIITPEWARRPVHILDLACRSAAAKRALPAKYK